MRVATKIISGYGILIVIMAALLAYQVISILQLERTVMNLSSVKLRSGRLSLDLIRHRDLVDEFVKKSLYKGDPDYAQKEEEYRDSFKRILFELQLTVRSPREIAETKRLSEDWNTFLKDLPTYRSQPMEQWVDNLPAGLADQSNRLGIQCQAVHNATLVAIDEEAETARQTGRRANLISWSAAATALVLSCIVSFLIVRSISRPLRQLTAGTRAIAEGRFLYRLGTSRQDEFAELARDFDTMTHRLSELDSLKKDFVSHVSHELKSPLASMQETIRILLEQIPGPLTDKQKRFLELNLQSARRLSAMIANLLDLSRIEAGTMQYDIKSHELGQLIRTAVAEIEPNASDKKLSIRVQQPDRLLAIECDIDRTIQVLENVLGNAIKFSPVSATIDVITGAVDEIPAGIPERWRDSLMALGGKSAFYSVTIADRGPGVPDEHKQTIFEKFHQLRSPKMAGQGVGLGLAISRTIVEAHGGAIWVEDNDGGGSRFVVLLPKLADGRHTRPVSPPI